MSTLPWYARAATSYGRPTVLIAAIALSAPGEYELARTAGWSAWVAWLMPFTISVYAAAAAALAASRPKGRRASAVVGSGFALLLALAAQVVAHLLASGFMHVSWWLIAVISAIPPAVVAHVLHLAATPVARADETPSEQTDTTSETRLTPALDRVSSWDAAVPAGAWSLPIVPRDDETHRDATETHQFLTTGEVAKRYGISVSTVRTWKDRGKITPAFMDPARGAMYDPETLPRLTSAG